MVGFAPLITNPLALVFGKRGVYLVSLLATGTVTLPSDTQYGNTCSHSLFFITAGAIAFWSPHITSNSLWVARSVLTGFFISPIFALTELSIADVVSQRLFSFSDDCSASSLSLANPRYVAQFFSHQRATPIAAYVSLLYISALLAPLLGAYIYLAFGYHAVFVSPPFAQALRDTTN